MLTRRSEGDKPCSETTVRAPTEFRAANGGCCENSADDSFSNLTPVPCLQSAPHFVSLPALFTFILHALWLSLFYCADRQILELTELPLLLPQVKARTPYFTFLSRS